MANPNLSQRQRSEMYPKMQGIYPEVCACCQKTLDECNLRPFDPTTKTGGFEIHHTSYQVALTDVEYARFMCHGCNHKQELSKEAIMAFENEISASHKANIIKHPIFLEWFSNEMVERNYHMPFDEIVNGGAYVSGANIKTVKGWLAPLTEHKEAPFGVTVVTGVKTVYLKGKELNLNMPNRTISDFNKAVDDTFKSK